LDGKNMHLFSAKIPETMTEANFQHGSCYQARLENYCKVRIHSIKKIILASSRDEIMMLEVLYSNLL